MRLFIAIFPPKEYQEYFRDVLRQFSKQKRNLNFSNIEQIHITLKFIGPFVSERSKALLIEQLKSKEGSYIKPDIVVNKIRFGFPRQSDGSILMADVAETPSLVKLAHQMHEYIKVLSLIDTYTWKDKHGEDFHFTVARLKSGAARSVGNQIKAIAKDIEVEAPPPFVAEEAFVVESEILNTGPVYKRIERIKL